MGMCMGSMNISIKDDAYAFLKSSKRKDESFSDVILRFKDRKRTTRDLLRFAGGLKHLHIDWDEREKNMRRFRKSFDKRIGAAEKHAGKKGKSRR